MSIDPIYPKSSGMAGINRFDKFNLDELNMLMETIRGWEPTFKGDDLSAFLAKRNEQDRILASKLFGEIAQARCKNEQKAKLTNSAYPCPTCKKPSVYCGCSSSCNHGSGPTPLRYCNHCEKSFSGSSSCSHERVMKDKKTITINGVDYEYCSYYDRLSLPRNHDGSVQHPAVACPQCYGMTFSITYGPGYKCVANCKCGHSMTIYDG